MALKQCSHLYYQEPDPDKRGLAMGVFSTSQFFGSFIGGVIGGWIYHKYGINSVFLFTISVAIIWLIFMSNLNLNFIKEKSDVRNK